MNAPEMPAMIVIDLPSPRPTLAVFPYGLAAEWMGECPDCGRPMKIGPVSAKRWALLRQAMAEASGMELPALVPDAAVLLTDHANFHESDCRFVTEMQNMPEGGSK